MKELNNLMKAGPLPLPAKLSWVRRPRPLVEYDGEKHYIDSVCSWAISTGFTETKLYRSTIHLRRLRQ